MGGPPLAAGSLGSTPTAKVPGKGWRSMWEFVANAFGTIFLMRISKVSPGSDSSIGVSWYGCWATA
ncbi:MAG: hypothetical protein ACREF4_03800 [Gammaproteobacteria bacterium]